MIGLRTYAQNNQVIYVRIQEIITSPNWGSYMTIAYPDDKTEVIELQKYLHLSSNAQKNAIIIRKKVNEIIDKGYILQSSSVGSDLNFSTTIMIFTKKE